MKRPVLLLTVSALLLAGCGDDGGDGGGTAAKTDTARAETAAQSTSGCKQVAVPKPKTDGGQRKPAGTLPGSRTYEVTLKTNCGSFTIRLQPKVAPNAAASFVALARKGFFDDTVFHRIVPGFVIQGGDPTASGQGGPGYSTRDTPGQGTTYTRGVVAMAKTGTEPAGTAGSQFYVVTGADAGLQPDYAVLGRVTKGLDTTVERIGMLGDPSSGETGTPTQAVVIQRATVSAR